MKQMHFFILNIHPSSELGLALQNILESSQNVRVQHRNYPPEGTRDLAACLSSSGRSRIDDVDAVFLVSSRLPLSEISSIVSTMNRLKPNLPVVIVGEESNPDEVIECLRLGAADYFSSPLRAIDILPRLWRLVDHSRRSATLTQTIKTRIGLKQMVGESPSFKKVINTIPVIAQSDVGVQISGETGTGKELCARAIHYLGPRASKPFLPVNCGAIPAELVENELFGHVRGAFTGATLSHGGLISEADGGTLFLDEIDCLPLPTQVKLLRFVQEKEFRQLGSSKTRKADVRIIAATNSDLGKAVKEGKFRQDLYYRLNIVHLALPPLRERAEDIPLLARHFLDLFTDEPGKRTREFSPDAVQKLYRYDWPGNVRELENVLKRAIIFAKGPVIQTEEIGLPTTEHSFPYKSFQAEKARIVAEFEKSYMQGLLQTYQGNITKAAQAAQKNRRAFWELIRKHNIDVQQFRHPSR